MHAAKSAQIGSLLTFVNGVLLNSFFFKKHASYVLYIKKEEGVPQITVLDYIGKQR
jgi:hypothetical protein